MTRSRRARVRVEGFAGGGCGPLSQEWRGAGPGGRKPERTGEALAGARFWVSEHRARPSGRGRRPKRAMPAEVWLLSEPGLRVSGSETGTPVRFAAGQRLAGGPEPSVE